MTRERNDGPGAAPRAAGDRPPEARPSWRVRRAIIVAALAYCAGISAWAVGQGAEMAGVVLGPAFGLAGGIIAAYVFGAAAEDVLISRSRT